MTKAPVFPEQRFILISRHKVDVKIPGINVAGRVFFGDNVDHGLVGKVGDVPYSQGLVAGTSRACQLEFPGTIAVI